MPKNPEFRTLGGDAPGTTRTDTSFGEGLEVSNASFETTYDFGESLGATTKADLKRGFCSYGEAIGEAKR